MEKLFLLEQIQPSNRSLVGEQAFHLGQLIQHGYPVLPGLVISAQVFSEFLETLNSAAPLVADLPHSSLHIDVDNPRQLQQVAQQLRQEIMAATLPQQWVEEIHAAAAAWATPGLMFRPSLVVPSSPQFCFNADGLLETQICRCQPPEIAVALKQTWSQLFRARSLFFWQRAGIGLEQIQLAVLVQPRRNGIASGTLSYHLGQIQIQATWGMEMALLHGEVLPDSYQIQVETGKIRQQLGSKTIAYRLIDSESAPTLTLLPQPKDSCLQPYLLSETQQQEYALKSESLQKLIQLALKLASELDVTFAWEWTISEATDSQVPEVYITQVRSANSLQLQSQHQLSSSLIQGIGAAKGQVVGPAYVITHSPPQLEALPSGVILVAPAIAPDWIPLLQKAVGVVTEQGGLTSHSAILARELGIPAVVNAAQATRLIQTGESLLVDGNRGEIYPLKASQAITLNHEYDEANSSIPTSTMPLATQLYVNLSQTNSLLSVKGLPVDGLGLLRSELMVLAGLEGQHPQLWLQQGRQAELLQLWQEQLTQFARAFAPRPVFYRSWDWRSPEFSAGINSTPANEANSMLGYRGTFSYLQDPTLFDLELTALAAVQQSGYSNLRLILPFVRTVEEFAFCRRRVEQAGLTQVRQFQLWIMAEVPSILFLLPEYVKAGVQGISIGTNDLTQLLLGVDREQSYLAAYDERHPVVMQAITQIIQLARQANIPCSICGQAPALYPELIDGLIRSGITAISVEVSALEQTYTAMARAEQRLLLEVARQQVRSVQ